MDQIVQILKALGDETRLKILIILSRKRICAKGIAKHLNISEAAVSQHIKVLKDAGIITGAKVGYYVHYDLQKATLREIVKLVEEINSIHTISCCKLGVHIPQECVVSCKAQKNKCCQKNK
ncbi:ArsR/SmtB family transcription factor [Geosporobacter ferrireducens]|uniref:Transcriptional regulator n=1 Tax=Geosporobacter ferrireducens TaxID=1424294 RepID=A0A1D8GKX0_9FIRM|nr:metalloregulator ArsR/SmtB family transcription factor [Geosporobacter ferrireducens]AOT71553.1 transcriptional regulator [Geosporobacter ferrireducens]MTI57865.1 winged helix-turn-helix transcriptional regulator [Geosporobacter ferrireducens]